MKYWRPKDWVNPYKEELCPEGADETCYAEGFEEGADAILNALIMWTFKEEAELSIRKVLDVPLFAGDKEHIIRQSLTYLSLSILASFRDKLEGDKEE